MCSDVYISHHPQMSSCVGSNLIIVSYNMHGYNQGVVTLKDLIANKNPAVMLL